MRFMLLADCQLGAYATFSGMNAADVDDFALRDMKVEIVPKVEGFAWDAARYERSIEIANEKRPEFVLVAGDMIDDLGDGAQVEELRRITSKLDDDIPIRWVPGNHDAAFDTAIPTGASLGRYRELFGSDRYAFTQGDTRFVVINTPVIDHPEMVPEEHREQMAFLEHELASAANRGLRSILVGHHPLFVKHADEPDTYWNLPLVRRRELLELIHRFGVGIGFAGHWHRNSIAFDGDFEMVTTGPVGYPLGEDPSGYRMVQVDETVSHEYFPLPEHRQKGV